MITINIIINLTFLKIVYNNLRLVHLEDCPFYTLTLHVMKASKFDTMYLL